MTRLRSKYTEKIAEPIKYQGNKGRLYDVISLTWGINNYDVCNRNNVLEEVNYSFY
jgi:hypothetical protein